jgi:hypothetical protein
LRLQLVSIQLLSRERHEERRKIREANKVRVSEWWRWWLVMVRVGGVGG